MAGLPVTGLVFLSASEPSRERDPIYWETQILVNIRTAVRDLVAHVLPRGALVYGGHPAITPMVEMLAARTGAERIACYQSRHFKLQGRPHVIETPAMAGRDESLLLMRYLMLDVPHEAVRDPGPAVFPDEAARAGWRERLHQVGVDIEQARAARRRALGDAPIEAGVFIGGMDGVECELNIFRSYHPEKPAYVLPTTGAAAARRREVLREQNMREMLEHETAYASVFQVLLPRQGGRGRPEWVASAPTPDERARHGNWSFAAR